METCTIILLLLLGVGVATRAEDAKDVIAGEDDPFRMPELDPRNPFYKGRPSIVFGSHAEPTKYVDEIGPDEEFPDPIEFYEKYIKQYKPVVFRGAGKHSPAYHLWTEEYLKENYGNLTVRLEARSEDSSRHPSGIGGLGRDMMGNFVDRYQTLDGYVISQVPAPMEKDVFFPSFLTCGSLAQGVQETHMFFSAKGGKTMLHRDPYSSFHCVFNGTKQWIVTDPAQKDKLYMSEDSRYEFGGYSEVNIDDIDYSKHPNIKDVIFDKIILRKGDCIYMPSGYTHQVRSRGYMNMAISIWFTHFMTFDPTGCEGVGNVFQPMSESSILWRFSGAGELTQGHMDVHVLRTVMKSTADKTGQIWLEEYTSNFIQGEYTDEDVLIARRLEFTKMLDPDQRGFITIEEVDALSLDTLKEVMEIIDPVDVANREDFEYFHVNKEGVWGAFSMLRGTDPSQTFRGSDFIKIYTIYLGGTEKVAKEILAILDPEGTDKISARMIMENVDTALENFRKNYHDATIEHLWYKQFVAKDVFRQFGVTHFDDPREEEDEKRKMDEESKAAPQCTGQDAVGDQEIEFVEDLDSTPVCPDKKTANQEKENKFEKEKQKTEGDEDEETDQHDEL